MTENRISGPLHHPRRLDESARINPRPEGIRRGLVKKEHAEAREDFGALKRFTWSRPLVR
jgi:hypothetical protein